MIGTEGNGGFLIRQPWNYFLGCFQLLQISRGARHAANRSLISARQKWALPCSCWRCRCSNRGCQNPFCPSPPARQRPLHPPSPSLHPVLRSATLFFVFIHSRGSCDLHPGQRQAPQGAVTPTRSTWPQPSHPQPFPSHFTPHPHHKLHLRRCWGAPSFAATSSPCCHPQLVGPILPGSGNQRELSQGGTALVGGCRTSRQSQTLADAQSQASTHSCASLKASFSKPTEWPNPASFAASGCQGTHQHHRQRLASSPRHPRIIRWEGGRENRLLENSASLLGGFSHRHGFLPEVSLTSTDPGHILRWRITAGTACSLSLPVCFLQPLSPEDGGFGLLNNLLPWV